MIRNLKVLLAAALALTALGAIAASAHAADEFHCSVSPCRGKLSTDGTGTTAHHVFIVENRLATETVAFTCESLRGTGELVSATDFSLSWSRPTEDREAYDNCTVDGSKGVVVHMNDCKYTFRAGSETNAAAGRTDEAEVHVECPTGETIEVTLPPPSTCVFDVGPQTLGDGGARGGIGYHTIGTSPNREVTVTANLHGIVVTERGNCSSFIKAGQELEGTYTTGNTLVTGQTNGSAMADGWFE